MNECPDMRISYSLFCRLLPFWILFPKASDRNTCFCNTHENLLYKIEKLHQLKVIDTTDATSLANEITCSTGSLSCMYRECPVQMSHLHSVSFNRFFWPSKIYDVLWYKLDQHISLIDEPKPVTGCHHEIDKETWSAICKWCYRQ